MPLLGAGTNVGPLQVSGFNYQPPLAHHGLRPCLTLCSEYRTIDTSGSLGTFIGTVWPQCPMEWPGGHLLCSPDGGTSPPAKKQEVGQVKGLCLGVWSSQHRRLQPRRKQLLRGYGCESTLLHISLRWSNRCTHCIRVLLTVVFAKH